MTHCVVAGMGESSSTLLLIIIYEGCHDVMHLEPLIKVGGRETVVMCHPFTIDRY